MSQSQTQPSFSGDFGAGIPKLPGYYGAPGIEDSSSLGRMTGISKMPMNYGLGQAGLGLSGQDVGQGFGQAQPGQQDSFNQMFQKEQFDPNKTLSF